MSLDFTFCLAHFCEAHGPCTVMTTLVVLAADLSHSLLPPASGHQTCASCLLVLPQGAPNMATGTDPVYLSQKYVTNPVLFASLKKVVMKSLSAETTTDSLPLMFGDVVLGYSIVRIFKVKDPAARGSERKYALILNTPSSNIMKQWDVVTESFDELVAYFHDRAGELERASTADDKDGELHNERFLRRATVKPRSLVDLMKDDELFVKVHLWVCDTLEALREEGLGEV